MELFPSGEHFRVGSARGFRSVRAMSASGRKHVDQALKSFTVGQGRQSSPAEVERNGQRLIEFEKLAELE